LPRTARQQAQVGTALAPDWRAVTAGDILDAARAYVRPEHLQIVTVGDPSVIRAPLEALALGPVHVYDTEGNPAAV